MARIRSVKPEFWTDRKLSRLSRDARLLYIALWNQADEWCRVHGDTRYVKGHCLPYDDDLSLSAIDRLLDELATAGHLQRYEIAADPYLYLPKMAKHQRLEPHKVPSRLPEPPKLQVTAMSAPRAEKSAPDSDEAAPDAESSETNSALQVAGSRVQVAGGKGQVTPPSGAQTLVAEWLDACRKRPPNPVVGQVAKLVSQMLAEGIDPHDVRSGLFVWASKGVHPAVLPSVVNEVMNAGAVPKPSTTDLRAAQGLSLVEHFARQEGA